MLAQMLLPYMQCKIRHFIFELDKNDTIQNLTIDEKEKESLEVPSFSKFSP
jgi:hypothetical protein